METINCFFVLFCFKENWQRTGGDEVLLKSNAKGKFLTPYHDYEIKTNAKISSNLAGE